MKKARILPLVLTLGTLLWCSSSQAQTNPYVDFINSWVVPNPSATIPAVPKTLVPSGSPMSVWDLEFNCRYALSLIWAATDTRCPATSSQETTIRANVEAVVDNVIGHLDATTHRWWWAGAANRTGDPNSERFVLISLCDVLHRAKMAGLFAGKMSGWLTALKPQIDFQYNNYGQNTSLDWSTVVAGEYANMDAAYALTMALASNLYTGPSATNYATSGAAFAAEVNSRTMPDGGTHYWLRSNENMHYHNYMICWMSRYYELTSDSSASTFLARTANYLPLSLGELSYLSGDFTHSKQVEVKYLDPWWKFTIDGETAPATPSDVAPATAEIAASYAPAGSLARRQNQWIANRLIYTSTGSITKAENSHVKFGNYCYYAIDRWTAPSSTIALFPKNKALRESNFSGPLTSPYSALPEDGYSHGFIGRFSAPSGRVFAWKAGRGDRQRSVGSAWLLNSDLTRNTTLQMISAEVRESAGSAGAELRTVAAYHAGSTIVGATVTNPGFSAYSAKYKPIKPWNTGAEPTGANFEVRQIGLYTPTHIITLVEMESLIAQSKPYIAVRVRSDRTPGNPSSVNMTVPTPGDAGGVGRIYAIGELRHKLLANNYPTFTHGAAVNDTFASQTHHLLSDEFILRRGAAIEPPTTTTNFAQGDINRAVIDTYPNGNAESSSYSLIAFGSFVGFHLTIDGHHYHVFLNKGTSTQSISNYNFSSNPGNAAVLYSSARADVNGHTAPVPISGTIFSESNIPVGGLVVIKVAINGYKGRDLGTVAIAGGYHRTTNGTVDTYTVVGSGAGIGTSDSCHFVTANAATGTGTLTARLTTADAVNSFAKYGIMVRGTEDTANAPRIFLRYTPSGEVKVEYRATTGGSSTVGSGMTVTLPCWLRVSRNGTTFRSYTSTDGTTWTALGSGVVISGFPATAYYGVAANSNDNTLIGSAVFDSVTYTNP